MSILDRLFDERYELETQKPKDEILAAIRSLIDARRKVIHPSSLFQNQDDSVIGIWGDKIEIKGVTTNDYLNHSIGCITIHLEETPTGTLIKAELKPYREQIQVPFLAFIISTVGPIVFKEQLHFTNKQVPLICIIWLILTMGLCLIGLLSTKNTLKNYFFNILRYIGLGT